MTKNGRKTKVFAYIGFPKNADASSPVPAVVVGKMDWCTAAADTLSAVGKNVE